jgi:hypothetical protein
LERATGLALVREAAEASGGGVFHVGGGISAPQAISTPDPEYTEEARRAKEQGTCVF